MRALTFPLAKLREVPDRDLKERRYRLAERVCQMSTRLHLIDDELTRRARERELRELAGETIRS